MILKYDKVTLEIIDCEMGLSEVTQTGITTPSDFPVPSEPTLDANTFSYASKLGLKSPVDLLVQWNITGYATKSVINNGVQNFSFKTGNSPGGIGYNENGTFLTTTSQWLAVLQILTKPTIWEVNQITMHLIC